jgi:hypothetical protein
MLAAPNLAPHGISGHRSRLSSNDRCPWWTGIVTEFNQHAGVRTVKRVSKKTRGGKTVPALAAAGLSLTLANEASLAATTPSVDTTSRKPVVSHEIVLREDEIFDVSLATFYVFDKERPGPFQSGLRLRVSGCCEFACLAGQAASEHNTYSSQLPSSPRALRPITPPRKPVQKRR